MAFGEALLVGGGMVIGIGLLLGLVIWSTDVWMNGDWLWRLVNGAVWILAVASALWFLSRLPSPA